MPTSTPLALLCTACLLAPPAYCTGTHDGRSYGFEENKGQITTIDGSAAPHVYFRLQQGSTQVFLLNNGIAYQFERALGSGPDADGSEELETFRMDMCLVEANVHPRITAERPGMDRTHYYTHDALHVQRYQQVTYHDVYPGIDWVIHTTRTGFKYDFVVHAGADPGLIRLRFDHHEELHLDADGGLVHGNRMGRFNEARPISLQQGAEVATAFQLNDNVLRFRPETYDRTKTLIIDPDRIWATYYGGTVSDVGNSVAVDGDGNVYLAGSTYSNNGIAEAGHQLNNAGIPDAFLVKFNAAGTRLWGTYYGGAQTEDGLACAVAPDGSVYLAGNTQSSSGIAFNGHQNTLHSPSIDAFLVKFAADGTRIWGTYYGYNGAEYGSTCAVDVNGNVYLAGGTTSTSEIAANGHQTNFGGGVYDAFLVKFDADGTRLWATYHGGSEPEVCTHMAVAPDASVYMVGNTLSHNNISAVGMHQPEYGGGKDSFIVKYAANGVHLWGSYYGGSNEEITQSCAVAANGDVYLAGSTNSTNGIAENGHQNTLAGNHDGFLAKFSSDGTRSWGTYYGGSSYENAFSCSVSADNSVYLAGRTDSDAGIAANGFQNTPGGWSSDAFIVRLNADGAREWGSYYGGSATEWGISCASSMDGHVYLAGHTNSSTGIASNGHQNTFEGTNNDAFLVKFHGTSGTGVRGTEPFQFTAYPNPTHTTTVIQLDRIGQRFELLDASGRVLQEGSIRSRLHTIDLSKEAPGTYLFRLSGPQDHGSVRLVKW